MHAHHALRRNAPLCTAPSTVMAGVGGAQCAAKIKLSVATRSEIRRKKARQHSRDFSSKCCAAVDSQQWLALALASRACKQKINSKGPSGSTKAPLLVILPCLEAQSEANPCRQAFQIPSLRSHTHSRHPARRSKTRRGFEYLHVWKDIRCALASLARIAGVHSRARPEYQLNIKL